MDETESDEKQAGLADFRADDGVAEDDGRDVAAEAAAVAGNGDGAADVVDLEDVRYPDADEYETLAVTQIDYTVEGRGDDEFPVVHVFGRTPDDERAVHVEVYEFDPYFYAPTDSLTDADLQRDRITGWEETDENGDPYESIRGERLTKIFGQTPRDVGQMREEFDHYEADILFPNRLLIDKDITSGVRVPARRETADGPIRVPHDELEPVDASVDPRVNTFDIEVDDRQGFPEEGEETIVCLTSHDSYDDQYIVWLYDSPAGIDPPEALDAYDPIEDDFEADVRVFEEEEAMLEAFVAYIEETDPDVLTGWNFDDFDAPYFLDRMEALQGPHHDYDLSIDRLSRVDEVWRSNWQGPDIKGRVVFDLLYAYQRTKFSELDSYRLDAVGEQELGVGKERYPGDIGDLWEDDPERLLEYNLRDVELCVELNEQQNIIPFWLEVASFVGCKLEDATTPGDAVDMYVLHKLHGNFALPSKGKHDAEDYEGGAVFDPITGVRENVTVLDLKSLYPMCMVTINASPETKVDPDAYDGETFRAPNGQHFRKEPDGVIREMVDELLSEREEKKSLRNDHDPDSAVYEQYDRQQAAVKVIMNCFTPDTDVLTPDGVRNIRDLDVGDEVYSLDPATMEMEVKPVVETHAYPDYRGELVDIETSKIDFSVTPNHRMLVRKNETNGITEDGWDFVEAGDLDDATNYELPHDWGGPEGDELDEVDLTEYLDGGYQVWVRPEVHGHTFAAEIGYYPDKVLKNDIGEEGYVFDAAAFEEHREYIEEVADRTYVHAESGRKWIPRTFDGDDFLELLAWYITEGNVYTSETKEFGEKLRGSATSVKIAQDAIADGGESHHGRIGDLLDRMGFDYYVDERSYQFTSKLFGAFLERVCGAGSFEKRIPEFVFETTAEQKRDFLDTLIAGDGDWQENSWRYSTASERLRDDVLRLCAHLGLTASYNEDGGTYRIYVTEDSKNTLRMHRSAERTTADDGVYCVTVADNQTLMAGQNGKFQFVGQSLYGVLGWDRFRLYDKEMGAAVTATGRDVIEYTDEVAKQQGYEVVYGDTDSVMLEVGQVSPEDVQSEVEVTDAMREKHPEMGEDELETIVATIEKGFELEEVINESYDDFALDQLNAEFHRFEIEFEKLYRRFFQAGKKKRYAGHIVWKEGKDVDDVDITGFEYQRSDIAPITKRVQKNVIDRIVHGEDAENIKTYVHDVIADFQDGNVDPEDVGIPGGIGQKLDNYDTDTAQVRGAKYANLLLGTNFGRGSKPKRLYLRRVHDDFFQRVEDELDLDPSTDPLYGEFKRDPDVICFEYADQLPDEFAVDWEKMLDKTLKGPIERILEALDISWDEVKSGQEQTGLGQYM
ncbi:DNA polymerase domain-containing protein [Halorientalis marina]|uniref:DNA polymerase domain-containing protein n=1 Tax=Halorientalis marina TaxID=2931976 RepID=UPI001FF548FE|nr:DNA polymerase domain-containing protein [Halorientalis marina]